MRKIFILFTCEHASNAIPIQFKNLFIRKQSLLASHRGFDMGTEYLGSALGKRFKAPVVYGSFSRLLIDLNRSAHHKNAFSEVTKVLSPEAQKKVIANFHRPHCEKIQAIINEQISKGFIVLHIGMHSFTPVLNQVVRDADIGILYDSRCKLESQFAKNWQKTLRANSLLRIRRNYPYLGKFDGLTTNLRKMYFEKKYIGLEIEINQLLMKASSIKMIEKLLVESLEVNLKKRPYVCKASS